MNVSDVAKKLQPYIRAVNSNLKKLDYFAEVELELEKIKLQNSNLNSDLLK